MWFLEFFEIEWETELSAIRVLVWFQQTDIFSKVKLCDRKRNILMCLWSKVSSNIAKLYVS